MNSPTHSADEAEIQCLTAITPDNQGAAHVQALDKMFEGFHAK